MDADAVSRHYASGDRGEVVLAALRAAGKDLDHLTTDDLAPLDQFHLGGTQATLALARLAGVREGMCVLDIGGGIGGPARTLASQFGCVVTVVDLTEEYCRLGALLTERTGLGDRVAFQQGDALNLPSPDGRYDLVWTQHSSMNIADKERQYAEIARVLHPRGRLALHEVMAGPVRPPHFPVPWARDPAFNFLHSPEDMRSVIARAGFREVIWNDVTDAAGTTSPPRPVSDTPPAAPLPLGIHLLIGPEFAAMARNYARNATEHRVAVIQAIFDRA